MIDTNLTPSVRIILPFYFFGAVWLLASSILLLLNGEMLHGHFFNPALLSITHMIVLGYITSLIFGALFQLLPVISGKKLYSEKSILYAFMIFQVSLVVFCTKFYLFQPDSIFIGSAFGILMAISWFACHAFISLKEAKSISVDFIKSSLLWLLLVCGIGVIMAMNFKLAILPADHIKILSLHFFSGLGGWIILLIIGVSSKLIPMFLLSKSDELKNLEWVWYGINFCLLLNLLNSITNLKIPFVIVFTPGIVGILIYLWYIADLYKKRIRKKIDTAQKQTRNTFFMLLISIFFLVAVLSMENPHPKNYSIFFILIIFGFIGYLIKVQIFKTLPFIVWTFLYKCNRIKTEKPSDLFSEKFLKIHGFIYISSIIGVCIGNIGEFRWLERLSLGSLCVSLFLFFLHVFIMIKPILISRSNG